MYLAHTKALVHKPHLAKEQLLCTGNALTGSYMSSEPAYIIPSEALQHKPHLAKERLLWAGNALTRSNKSSEPAYIIPSEALQNKPHLAKERLLWAGNALTRSNKSSEPAYIIPFWFEVLRNLNVHCFCDFRDIYEYPETHNDRWLNHIKSVLHNVWGFFKM